jgi:phage shock protein PspC (stress-responsive transcriptional regulator)
VGAIADRYGIEHTLVGLSFIPLVAAGVSMLLPERAPVPA